MQEVARSSAQQPDWIRTAIPSAADLIFVGLLTVLAFTPLSLKLLGDAGLGWHIRTGQQILAQHSIPRVDSFSSTMQGQPWFAWEWLYDVVAGELDAFMGLNGVVWFTAAVIATVFAWTFRWLVLRGTNLLVALLLTLLAISASMIHFLARPHVLSWLFALAWFAVLDGSERSAPRGQRLRTLWILPCTMLVWVNVHGGFLLGFVMLGIFWISAVWEWRTTKAATIDGSLRKIAAAKRVRSLSLVGLVTFAASLVNPYGWRLYQHVYSYLTNRFLMDHIEEFQSPNFHGLAQKCFAILVLIALATLAARGWREGREARTSGVLIVLFAVYSGLYAARNIPVASVLMVVVIGPLIPSINFASRFFRRMTEIEAGLRWHLWPGVAVVATFLIAMNGGHLGSDQVMNAHFDSKRMPVHAVDYLMAKKMPGPILSVDYWGGYLVYRMHPEAHVVLDDRHDLYGEEFFKSYLKMIRVEQGWQDFLDAHESSCLLLPRNSALANVLITVGKWRAIYEDDLAVVFVRT